jgi:hypothetical protein
MRRGALVTMALAGTPVEVLLHLSGHTSVKSLRRYLGYGLYERATHDLAAAATVNLL